MDNKIAHIINGKPIKLHTRQLDVYNPAEGIVIASVSVADKSLVSQAVEAAQHAFSSWSATPATNRAKLLFKYKTLLDKHIKSLAKVITREHGKNLIEAEGSVQRGIDVLETACGIALQLKGGFSAQAASGVDCYSMRQPLGVCAGITPFNFPGMVPLWMFPIAIACGNTFVLKPSEKDPSCSNMLLELALEAGIPDGVINLVHGDKETVDHLLEHPDVKAISFVGSSTVAEYVYKSAVKNNKRVQAFGGAKNHCIVMPDADMDKAVKSIVASAYGSAGERCMALSVVIAIEGIADMMVEKMLVAVNELKVGDGAIAGNDIGPLITQAHWDKVNSYIELGKKEGAKLIVDGSSTMPKGNEKGFFMSPCLFDHVDPDMKIYQDEIFGPVLCIVRVPDFESALQLINQHQYGNGTAIFTRDGYTAREFVEKVEVGMVGVNVPIPVPVPTHSFGGWKQSIFSDIGMYGDEAVRFYTKLKTVTQRWYPGK